MIEDIQSKIQKELQSDEILLWSGKSKKGMLLHSTDIIFIPFSIMWCGITIFGEWNVLSKNVPLMSKLGGIPFVLFGLYLMLGRFIVDARIREKQIYVITNKRIIILTNFIKYSVTSFTLRNLDSLKLTEKKDASGSISFEGNIIHFGGMEFFGLTSLKSIELIENVREVYSIIVKAQNDLK